MPRRWQNSLLPLLMSACASSPPATAPVLWAAAPESSAARPVASLEEAGNAGPDGCELASRWREQARVSIAEGKLFRALRLLARGARRCPGSEQLGRVTRVEALAELGNTEAAALAEDILHAPQSTDDDRRRARAALALVMQRVSSPPDDPSRPRWRTLFALAQSAASKGDAAEAQRLRERTVEALESASQQRAEVSLPTNLGHVTALAIASDGRHFAFAAGPEVFVCTRSPLRRVRRFLFPRGVFQLAFSPDSSLLAIHVSEMIPVRSVENDDALPTHRSDAGGSLVWSRDGKNLVFGGNERAEIWDARSGRQLAFFDRSKQSPERRRGHGVEVSQDGRLYVFLLESGEIVIWTINTSRYRSFPLTGGRSALNLALSPDGQTVAAWNSSVPPMLWDLHTGRLRRRLAVSGPFESTSGLRWSPDGKTVATSSQGKILRWEVSSWRELPVIDTVVENISRLEWSPDGQSLALNFNDSTVSWWSLSTGKIESVVGSRVAMPTTVAWSPDGHSLATGAADGWVRR